MAWFRGKKVVNRVQLEAFIHKTAEFSALRACMGRKSFYAFSLNIMRTTHFAERHDECRVMIQPWTALKA